MVGSSRTSRLISVGLPANIVNDRYVCLQKVFTAIAVVEVSTEIRRTPLVIPSGLLSYTLYFSLSTKGIFTGSTACGPPHGKPVCRNSEKQKNSVT